MVCPLVQRYSEPHDLVHRSKVMTNDRAETFTLNIDPSLSGEHKITITGEEAKLKRATDLAALIERFSADLPGNVNITFTKHDQPACALGYQHKERLLELVSEGDCEFVFFMIRLSPRDLVTT